MWCPYQHTWKNRFESVQKKFVKYALRRLPWRDTVNLPPYEQRCNLLGLNTLEHRRFVAQAVFVGKILKGDTDSEQILTQLDFYAPERTLRQRDFLSLDSRRTEYGRHEPIRFMATSFNEVYHLYDFNFSNAAFQRKLLNRGRELQWREFYEINYNISDRIILTDQSTCNLFVFFVFVLDYTVWMIL